MLKKIIFLLVISFVISHPIKAQKVYKKDAPAAISIDDAELCELAVHRMEEKYDIKENLLYTISSVETGRWDYEREKFISWPWSINVNGKGYRFNSKEEAIAEVKRLQAKGIKSIDVGCMQISLKYHKNAFKNIEEAFDPDTNVEYSAQFLKNLYDKRGSWQSAAMAYHSKVPSRGLRYKNKLISRFNEIKLAHFDNHETMTLF